jgi:ureidoglycolate lyase
VILKPEPLTGKAFAPFGEVVEIAGARHFPINQGFAERFADLAAIDISSEGGSTTMGIVVAQPRPEPIAVKLMERHPLGSQLFYPLQDRDWLVLVCTDPHNATGYRAFRAHGQQGVNYARNTWHHPLLVLHPNSRFLVIDRQGPGSNLEEVWLNRDLHMNVGQHKITEHDLYKMVRVRALLDPTLNRYQNFDKRLPKVGEVASLIDHSTKPGHPDSWLVEQSDPLTGETTWLAWFLDDEIEIVGE